MASSTESLFSGLEIGESKKESTTANSNSLSPISLLQGQNPSFRSFTPSPLQPHMSGSDCIPISLDQDVYRSIQVQTPAAPQAQAQHSTSGLDSFSHSSFSQQDKLSIRPLKEIILTPLVVENKNKNKNLNLSAIHLPLTNPPAHIESNYSYNISYSSNNDMHINNLYVDLITNLKKSLSESNIDYDFSLNKFRCEKFGPLINSKFRIFFYFSKTSNKSLLIEFQRRQGCPIIFHEIIQQVLYQIQNNQLFHLTPYNSNVVLNSNYNNNSIHNNNTNLNVTESDLIRLCIMVTSGCLEALSLLAQIDFQQRELSKIELDSLAKVLTHLLNNNGKLLTSHQIIKLICSLIQALLLCPHTSNNNENIKACENFKNSMNESSCRLFQVLNNLFESELNNNKDNEEGQIKNKNVDSLNTVPRSILSALFSLSHTFPTGPEEVNKQILCKALRSNDQQTKLLGQNLLNEFNAFTSNSNGLAVC